ncbi:MAG: DUF1800 domain-containing protein [Verrucomicrobiota bacterium]|nr:DUF1800 domain-containing protein [Verrucomicrobiota bacterium]
MPTARWDSAAAAHLLSRAAFGGTADEIEKLRGLGLYRAVDALLDAPRDNVAAPELAKPRDLKALRMEARAAKQDGDRSKAKQMRKEERDEMLDLRAWWLQRMATTSAPLLEKMTLFWHGHFATSFEKVKDGYWMWLQNETLRTHALGAFAQLTKAMLRDPAMMRYLDLQQSRPEHPNENWARELMELFTIGIGNYTEQDVKEGARAFTGYRLDLTTQQSRFVFRQHDGGTKKFLGRVGNFGGDDIIDILAQQPACGQFLGKKLCRFFIEDEPAPALVAAVAERLRAHNLELKPVLREIFTAAEFYDPRVQRAQIKSPTQFVVQTCKVLRADLPAPLVAQNAMRQMGQMLFQPPNVKGWDGGKSWISTSTLLFRNNFANYLINGDGMLPVRRAAALAEVKRDPIDVSKIVSADIRASKEKLIAHLSQHVLQMAPSAKDTLAFSKFLDARKDDGSDDTIRGLLHLMMSTPVYQLT